MSDKKVVHKTLEESVEERGGEVTNPYLIYEMALGGGCTEYQARKHMQQYCLEVGLDPLCP